MYVEVTIDRKIKNDMEIHIDEFDNELKVLFIFKNLNSYIKYKKNIIINKDLLFHETNIIKRKRKEKYLKKYKLLLEVMIEKTVPKVRLIDNLYNWEEIFKYDDKLIIDLEGVSFNKKLTFLTDFRNNKKNFKYIDEYTHFDLLTHEETINMFTYILNICQEVKNKNLSQAETITYLYELIKKRPYLKNINEEDLGNSRNLSKIINNPEIVCVGFTNFIKACCDILNINLIRVHWKNNKKEDIGHQSLIAFLNDQKYNLIGIYGIDVTWDSKKNKNENNDYKIKHLLMPAHDDLIEKSFYNLTLDSDFCYYSLLKKYEEYNMLKQKKINERKLMKLKINMIEEINTIYELLNLKYRITTKCVIDKEIWLLNNITNKIIPLETLESIYKNVTSKDTQEIVEAIMNSYHYKEANKFDQLNYQIARIREK